MKFKVGDKVRGQLHNGEYLLGVISYVHDDGKMPFYDFNYSFEAWSGEHVSFPDHKLEFYCDPNDVLKELLK